MKIVSGGQTGADRGGLDAAIELGLEHGGWCPKGRRAEDGTIPARYALVETSEKDYEVRTERNVRDSDATVVFTHGKPEGGSAVTVGFARKHAKPCLAVDLDALDHDDAAEEVRRFLVAEKPRVLNVAGSRESRSPGIAERVKAILIRALAAPR